MLLTNRDIASTFRFTLPQVRRWAVVALGTDPVADKGKGIIREYSLDDAFKIYMVGKLIDGYRIGLVEAKEHLNNIWPYLGKYNLLPSQNTEIKKTPKNVQIKISPGPNYDLRFLIDRETISKDEHIHKYKIITLKPYCLGDLGPIWIIGLGYHLWMFSKFIRNFYESRG